VSATDVLHGRVAAGALRDKIVIVGATAAGTWDQRVTPFDESAPGVVAHATFVDNVLAGELLRRSGAVVAGELVAMLALSLGLAWLGRPPGAARPRARRSPWWRGSRRSGRCSRRAARRSSTSASA
jgi:adenylate cyclase